MKHQVFIISGGNVSDSYEEYLEQLKKIEVTLEKLRFRDWKVWLGEKLGAGFEVFMPRIPNPLNAKYLEWKIYFEKLIPLMNEKVVLVGHSLGGIFLAKFLAEETFPKKIRATFLVAAPFETRAPDTLADFVLPTKLDRFEKQGGDIFLYQSGDDVIVPPSNMRKYQQALPKAHCTILNGRGHFNADSFPELEKDIRSLKF